MMIEKGIKMDNNMYNNEQNGSTGQNGFVGGGQNNFTNNQQMNWNQQPYNNYQQPFQPQPKKKKGLGIAALVIGILSMTLCCTIGSILGIVGIILGIVSLVKKEDMPGLGIAGIITSVIGFFVGIYVAFCVIVAYQIVEEEMDSNVSFDEIYEELDRELEYDDVFGTQNEFAGEAFLVGESAIYFDEDGTFTWYQSNDDYDDNYFYGTYELRFAEEAEDYLVDDLSMYGITQEELDDYYARNIESDFYTIDKLCVLTLHNEIAIVEGESCIDEAYDTHYYGHYSDGYFDSCNMSSAEYVPFVMME